MENETIDLTESGGDAAPLLQDLGDAVFSHGGVNDPPLDFESAFPRDELDTTWVNLHSLVEDLIGDGGQHPVSLIFSDLYHNCYVCYISLHFLYF